MSYGRSPYYIYQGEYDEGERYFCFMDGAVVKEEGEQLWANIEYDAMAQFAASMWKRDNRAAETTDMPGELGDLIRRGFEVRPDLKDKW